MKTIKLISTAALILLIGTTGNAQTTTTTTGKTTSFGVKGGVNFANVRGDDFDGPNARTSFHVGVLAEFPLTDAFSVQTEALYSGQGFQTDIEGSDGKIEYKLDYINVPVLAKIYLTDGLSIEAGPQFSFKVSEQIDDEGAAGGTDTDEAESFDFGVAGGLTFQTSMGFFASGRYTLGLTDIIKDQDAKNTVFQIGVGYKF
ncbi:MAG: porin family protein [Flavobacterium sp.]|nr:porin family protein [Flavobacterium sp.]